MTNILSTIWALGLNIFGVNIFHICFANSMVDDDDNPLITGLPITSQLFACGVYIIVVNTTIFPTTFRKPFPPVLCFYEFLATAFILEFSVACIWTPIDVLVITRLPTIICRILNGLKYEETGEWISKSYQLMASITIIVSGGFFISSLHVTRAVELSDVFRYGIMDFTNQVKSRLWRRIMDELPKADVDIKDCYCPRTSNKSRKKRKSKTRRRSSS